MIGSIVVAVAVALIALIVIASVYRAPSCSDGKQNQAEQGVDCGGPCPYLCAEQVAQPIVRFVRPLPGLHGRTDILAYVDNPNAAAASRGARYTLALYGADRALLAELQGTLDLPPASTVPLFVPGVSSGAAPVSQAFLSFDTSTLRFFTATKPLVPIMNGYTLGGSTDAPRVEATLVNPSAESALDNVRVVGAVFDSSGEVIAASATLVPRIAAGGSAQALFTWTAPFASAPARVDVLPVPSLP